MCVDGSRESYVQSTPYQLNGQAALCLRSSESRR